jgi:hypothetical protein
LGASAQRRYRMTYYAATGCTMSRTVTMSIDRDTLGAFTQRLACTAWTSSAYWRNPFGNSIV